MLLWSPEKPEGAPSINISIKGEEPWNRLSWDYQHGQIPVPGFKGMYSETVRGIYEGLKLIGQVGKRGKINPGYFVGPGRERTLDKEEWLLGFSVDGICCGIVEFNDRVLTAAYDWVLKNRAHDVVYNLKQLVAKHTEAGEDLYVYDGIENGHRLEHDVLSPAFILYEHMSGATQSSYQ